MTIENAQGFPATIATKPRLQTELGKSHVRRTITIRDSEMELRGLARGTQSFRRTNKPLIHGKSDWPIFSHGIPQGGFLADLQRDGQDA